MIVFSDDNYYSKTKNVNKIVGWQLHHLYIVAQAQNALIIIIINKILET